MVVHIWWRSYIFSSWILVKISRVLRQKILLSKTSAIIFRFYFYFVLVFSWCSNAGRPTREWQSLSGGEPTSFLPGQLFRCMPWGRVMRYMFLFTSFCFRITILCERDCSFMHIQYKAFLENIFVPFPLSNGEAPFRLIGKRGSILPPSPIAMFIRRMKIESCCTQ